MIDRKRMNLLSQGGNRGSIPLGSANKNKWLNHYKLAIFLSYGAFTVFCVIKRTLVPGMLGL